VSVDFEGVKPEHGELLCQRSEIGDFLRRAEALETVCVDDDREVRELVVGGEYQCFPVRPFVPFSV